MDQPDSIHVPMPPEVDAAIKSIVNQCINNGLPLDHAIDAMKRSHVQRYGTPMTIEHERLARVILTYYFVTEQMNG